MWRWTREVLAGCIRNRCGKCMGEAVQRMIAAAPLILRWPAVEISRTHRVRYYMLDSVMCSGASETGLDAMLL
jgi:hypothetical protein